MLKLKNLSKLKSISQLNRINNFYPKYIYNFSQSSQASSTSVQQPSIKINSYLLSRLDSRKYIPLKDFQLQAFKTVDEQKKNCFINSCTGSGKTLGYLVPVLNQILNEKDDKLKLINKNTLIKSNKQLQSLQLYQNNQKHGALIFTLNKQLALQIYKQIRLIDIENRLNVYRIGPISHFAPVVQLLNKKQKSQQDQDIISTSIDQNIIKCISWSKTDILIATPQMFWNVMTTYTGNKNKNQNEQINPKFLVIDEADLLLEIDQNVSKYMKMVIQQIKKSANHNNNSKESKSSKFKKLNDIFFHQNNIQDKLTKDNNKNKDNTQFLMSSSSFPKKINKQPYQQYFKRNFSPIQIISGINKHRLPERLQLNYIQIQAKSDQSNGNEANPEVLSEKLYYLQKILTNPQKKSSRFIIFCNSKQSVQKVSYFISSKLNFPCIQYYASLPSDQRSHNLYRFMNQQQNCNILISTDLGSRGLDFNINNKQIHSVIEFDMAENIVAFINRAGRTARNQLPGEVITFVQDKNKVFFQHLAQLNANDEEFDELFSRKRSYNKMVLKYIKNQQNKQNNSKQNIQEQNKQNKQNK